jgi:hypothetical protein
MKRYSLRVNIEHEFASWISGGVNFGILEQITMV